VKEHPTIELYQLHYPVIAPLIMSHGIGDGKTSACVMAQAATIDALRRGETLIAPTDKMECACPLLRHMAIALNDALWWEHDLERTQHLRPLIPLLLDSRISDKRILHRATLAADQIIRRFVPMTLSQIVAADSTAWVFIKNAITQIGTIPPITDIGGVLNARVLCQALQSQAGCQNTVLALGLAIDIAAAVDIDFSVGSPSCICVCGSIASAINYSARVSLFSDFWANREWFINLFRAMAAIKEGQ